MVKIKDFEKSVGGHLPIPTHLPPMPATKAMSSVGPSNL